MRKGEDGQFYCLGCDYVNHNKNTVKGRFSSRLLTHGTGNLDRECPDLDSSVALGFVTLRAVLRI